MLQHPIKAVYLDGASLQVDEKTLEPLKALFDEWQYYSQTSPSEVNERLQGAQVVICNKTPISKEIIEESSTLKLILVTATGTNNVDLAAAKAKGISVCNCQAYGTESVSQHTLMLMLALSTHFLDYNMAVKKGVWQHSSLFCLMDYPIMELSGKTLGIIGYGELGKAVANLAKAFGMNILVGQIPNRPKNNNRLKLSELLPQVDILTLHCPLTKDTNNLITKNELSIMKKEALVINTARGGIINEQDLVNALKNRQIAGAATDVLTVEPPKEGNPLLDQEIPNLIITPHIAWASQQAQQRIVEQTIENVKAFMSKKPIRSVV